MKNWKLLKSLVFFVSFFFMWFARFQILLCEPQSIWCNLLELSYLTSMIFSTLIFNGHMMQQACSLFPETFISWLSFFRVVRAFLIEQCVFFNDFADWLLDGPSETLGCGIFEVASFMTIWIVGILQTKCSSTLF